MKKLVCVLFLFSIASAQASEITSTTITRVLVGPTYENKVFLTIEPESSGGPNCHTNGSYSYVFDASTESGRITLDLVLEAYNSGTRVWIRGSDDCDLYSNVEDLKFIASNKKD